MHLSPSYVTGSLFSASQFVINISDIVLSREQIDLLDRGLTFIPTATSFPLSYLTECRKRNVRNIMIRDFFRDKPRDFDKESFANLFVAPSTWDPPLEGLSGQALACVDRISSLSRSIVEPFISQDPIKGSFIRCKSLHSQNNLSESQFSSIFELGRRKDIVIKPADKGGAVVVMSREAYKAEGLRQLENPKYYKEIEGPLAASTVIKINTILQRMVENGFLSRKQFDLLKASVPTNPRAFYLLPKVHKPQAKWPQSNMPEGRPIVSDSGSETYQICRLIDYYLKPLATRHASYVKDTYDFVQKIVGQSVPPNSFLVTADVTALYPNMNINRSLRIVRELFAANPCFSRPDSDILELLDIALNINDFEFANRFFIQLCGTAMGKTFAPNLANIYMLEFDEAARNGFKIKPLLYHRFLDDIFFVWPGTREELNEFGIFLNSIIEGIVITMNIRESIVEFLDTRIFKAFPSEDSVHSCTLATSVYFKDTDTHQLLHASSFHPRHTTRGILKSQLIRFKRLSFSKYEYDFASKTLFDVLCKRGYSRTLFRRLKTKVWYSTEYALFSISRPSPGGAAELSKMFPIVNYFDRVSMRLMQATRDSIASVASLSHFRVINAYKIHRNLSQYLVRSRFRED